MSLVFSYHPKLPHNEKWSVGYNIGMSCQEFYKNWFSKRPGGPKNGEKILLEDLPYIGKNLTFVRFWAARPNKYNVAWSDFNDAYKETSEMEIEPEISYFNGGMIPINCKGQATFRLYLPPGYMSKNGYINPHFHYRVCKNGIMGPVHTVYINRDCPKKKCNLLLLRNNSDVNKNLSHLHQRLLNQKVKYNTRENNDYRNSNMCQTLLETGCNHYEILSGPVSGTMMGSSNTIEPLPQ